MKMRNAMLLGAALSLGCAGSAARTPRYPVQHYDSLYETKVKIICQDSQDSEILLDKKIVSSKAENTIPEILDQYSRSAECASLKDRKLALNISGTVTGNVESVRGGLQYDGRAYVEEERIAQREYYSFGVTTTPQDFCKAVKVQTDGDVTTTQQDFCKAVKVHKDASPTILLVQLFQAVEKGDLSAIKSLIAGGVDVNAREDNDAEHNKGYNRRTLLMAAADSGYLEVAEFLLSKGADVKMRDDRGWPAFMYAVSNGSMDVARLLVSKGADPKANSNDGITGLMLATSVDMAEFLLSKNVDVNASDSGGKTALMYAAEKNNLELIKIYVARHADVNAKANDGMSVWHYASGDDGQLNPCTEYLTKHGAVTEKPKDCGK